MKENQRCHVDSGKRECGLYILGEMAGKVGRFRGGGYHPSARKSAKRLQQAMAKRQDIHAARVQGHSESGYWIQVQNIDGSSERFLVDLGASAVYWAGRTYRLTWED